MRLIFTISIFISFISCSMQESPRDELTHPNLILTIDGVNSMRSSLGSIPLFDQSLEKVRSLVDAEINRGIEVPIPKDLAGGYTHERHKANFFAMQKAGVLFQITENEKYAIYIRDMLLQYAEIYPELGKHPAERSYARGKFFWQCLNDANWLVYTSQAYDCIYEWLEGDIRLKLNRELFRPYAEYISIKNPQFFNRIHNHSTWGNAAVGMIGLVMNDDELVSWALEGLALKNSDDAIDNDGGAIKLEGQKEAGFFAQLDNAFSPDGYYTEGPYYQRYAMYPFLIFAQALSNKKPELEILRYRDDLLLKAVYALINQTNSAGEFFPINDSQKGMSLASRELVHAVSMAYHYGDKDPKLLSIVERQGEVPLNDSGLSTARDISKGKSKPFDFKSIELRDGASGKGGAIGILRKDALTLVMKYAKQGMGHGHFDRLGFLLYNESDEVIQDYGSARWVNIEQKDGGGYLKENKTWAKQTIAHNTLVINKDSHFDGNVQVAERSPGTPHYFSSAEGIQVVSAKELNAYKDVQMQRTIAILDLEELQNPLVMDLFSVQSQEGTRYDLPLYFLGEFMSSNHVFKTQKSLNPMGENDGYQHLWLEAEAELTGDVFQMTWFNQKNFYTITSAVRAGDQALLTRIGANDPNFNLRRDPGLIHRRTGGNTLFANLYEVHGQYDYNTEIPVNSYSSLTSLKIIHESEDHLAIQFEIKNGERYQFAFSQKDDNKSSIHTIQTDNGQLEWTGVYEFKKINKDEQE